MKNEAAHAAPDPIQARLIQAAQDFCHEETALRASRRALRRCEEYSPSSPTEPGQRACEPEDEEPCTSCAARFGNKDAYRGSLRRRYRAKERMLTAYRRLTVDISELGGSIQAGAIFQFSYPFFIEDFSVMDADGVSSTKSWRPGVRFENIPPDTTEAVADGIGQQIVTVVSTFKPGKFPERVFYTRQWRDPSGKVFGKGSLKMTSIGAFRNMVRGYRYEFELSKSVAL